MKGMVRGKVRVTVRLPLALYRRFRVWAESRMLSESRAVVFFITRGMEEQENGARIGNQRNRRRRAHNVS